MDCRDPAVGDSGGGDVHLSCQLLVCSSAITEDLYKAFLRKNAGQKELVWVGRMMVLVVATVAIARRPIRKTACWVW